MKSLDDYKKELEKLYAASQAEDIAASDKKYETEKKLTNDQYNRQINETENSYEDLYRENAVQKLINEREVAENMANLGLTDSGLNRTQQTAVQLSYANNKNKIDTTRQKAVDQLTYSLADAISKLDTAKTEAAAGIKSNYASAIASGAQDMYNKALAEETERIKSQNEYDLKMAELSAQQKANTPYYKFVRTGIGDNGKTQYYFEDQNGNIKYYDEGINPYTGSPISGYTKEQLKKYGVWNGYQPKGVVVDGYDYGKVELVEKNSVNYQGHLKSIWKTNESYRGRNGNPVNITRYWIWDDLIGNYIPAKMENGSWYINVPE